MKKPVWEYNGKYYLEINGVKVKEAKVENASKKEYPYIMELSFSNMIFRKMESRLQVIVFPKFIKYINLLYIHTEWDYQNQL